MLAAGGARGAYQAGVLKRIGEIPAFRGKPTPFPIVTGASAGAINGTYFAAGSADITETSRLLAQLWAELRIEDVYRTGPVALGAGAARWIRDLSFGGFIGGGEAQSLLDSSPLRPFLAARLRFSRIRDAIKDGHLYAAAVSATNYYSGKSYTFIQGREGHPIWTKSRRVALATDLTIDHVMASAAIPIVFSPVFIASSFGDFYYGDGALRLVNPLSPAIRLGASRVFAIGIRSQKAAEARSRNELLQAADGPRPSMRMPPLAQVFGVALNAIFLDHLDTDLEHLQRMNELIRVSGDRVSEVREPIRELRSFAIQPSEDLASVAESLGGKFPRLIRYFMEGLGSSRAESSDLMSYLLFDSAYTRALVDIGYRDAGERADEIEAFLRA